MMMMSGFLLSSADADEIVCIFLNYLSKNNERDKGKCDHHLVELATIVSSLLCKQSSERVY